MLSLDGMFTKGFHHKWSGVNHSINHIKLTITGKHIWILVKSTQRCLRDSTYSCVASGDVANEEWSLDVKRFQCPGVAPFSVLPLSSLISPSLPNLRATTLWKVFNFTLSGDRSTTGPLPRSYLRNTDQIQWLLLHFDRNQESREDVCICICSVSVSSKKLRLVYSSH